MSEAGRIMINPNAGSSTLGGEGYNANLFVTSYQNDQVLEVRQIEPLRL